MAEPLDLVYIDKYNLLGKNFYWYRYEAYGMTKEDILHTGLTDDRIQVSKKIIDALVAVDSEMQKRGWRLYLKEGYRSEALYKMAYEKRVIKFGKEATDATLNMSVMPHSLGTSVDVVIWDIQTNKEIYLRNGTDEPAAYFIHFYAGKEDPESKRYQDLQDYLAELMMKHGFRFASLKEYWHFDYKPEIPENYK